MFSNLLCAMPDSVSCLLRFDPCIWGPVHNTTLTTVLCVLRRRPWCSQSTGPTFSCQPSRQSWRQAWLRASATETLCEWSLHSIDIGLLSLQVERTMSMTASGLEGTCPGQNLAPMSWLMSGPKCKVLACGVNLTLAVPVNAYYKH